MNYARKLSSRISLSCGSEGVSGNGFGVALIGGRMVDMVNLDILVSGTQNESHSHNKTIFHKAVHIKVHIQGRKFAVGVLPSLDLEILRTQSMIEMLMNSGCSLHDDPHTICDQSQT